MSLPTLTKTWQTENVKKVDTHEFMTKLKDSLVEQGWTLRYSGVIYDHDPGDEHVEPSRWANTSSFTRTEAPQGSWVLTNPKEDMKIEYAEPRPDAKL